MLSHLPFWNNWSSKITENVTSINSYISNNNFKNKVFFKAMTEYFLSDITFFCSSWICLSCDFPCAPENNYLEFL